VMYRDNYHNPKDNFFATQKPNEAKVSNGAAKAGAEKLCNCPGSEPRKVKIGINEHIPGCRFRGRSSRYATKTSVIPSKIVDGCSLGVVLGEENY
jgi:hypothetical protein